MENILYTQEGHSYVLRCVTENVANALLSASNIILGVEVNLDPSGTPGTIHITNQSNRIIPIMAGMHFSNLDGSGNPQSVVDITSPYYTAQRGTIGNQVPIYEQQRSQIKLFPFVQRDFLTSDSFYNFSCFHNYAVFSTDDFLDPSAGLFLRFSNNQTLALTENDSPSIPIAAGQYDYNTHFLFYELRS